MVGLLDTTEDPRTLGLLSLGMRLMSTPGRFGTALGQAGLGALGDLQQAQQLADVRKLREQQMALQQAAEQRAQQQFVLQQQLGGLQVNEAARVAAEREAQAARDEALLKNIPSPQAMALQSLGDNASPTMANAARLPQINPRNQFLYDALQARQIKPMEYFQATKPQAPEYKVVGNSLVRIGGGEVTEAYRPAPTFDPAKDLLIPGPDGKLVPNVALLEIKRQLVPKPTTVNVTNADNKFASKAAEVQATEWGEVFKQGQAANRTLAQIGRLEGLLAKTGGGFTPAIKAYAGQFGVSTSGLDDIQAAEALIQSLIPQQRPPGSGTMSDRDVEMFRQSLPRLINQPGGNQKILRAMRGIAEYDRKMGQIASDALNGKITREQAAQQMSTLANPLTDFGGGEDIHSQAEAIIKGAGNGKR